MVSDLIDKDLQSVQEVRQLVTRCREAQRQFAEADAALVDRVCTAMSEVAFSAAKDLAYMAYDETGYGVAEHKVIKNQFAARGVWESIKDKKTVGVVHLNTSAKVVTIAEPVGVIAALTPSTNPTSTAIFKALISVKGRNGLVISPHPSAAKSTLKAVQIISDAAEKAGAPKGLIACVSVPTLAGTQELLKHYAVNLILATGGGPMVRAAHSVGKPAYGVGPGNVPAYVSKCADVPKAAADIVRSKSFDCSLICATEQTVVADKSISQQLRTEMERNGALWLSDDEADRIANLIFTSNGGMDAKYVGKSAKYLANKIGMQVTEDIKVLVANLSDIGISSPLSGEKLTTVLGYIEAENHAQGVDICRKILKFGGDGHTAAIHASNEALVTETAHQLPAFRIVVNSMSTLGAVGHNCNFSPSFTLGTGGIGGAIVGDNITVTHLINYKRVAWETRSWTEEGTQCVATQATPHPSEIDDIVRRVLETLARDAKAA